MKKRILALLCAFAVALGICTLAATPAQASDEKAYQVGYSKKDVNPWVDPSNHHLGLLSNIPLSGGYGTADNRIDDNGDNKVDDSDGWFVTCTVITDSLGSTLVFLTLDTISPIPSVVNLIRTRITSKIAGLSADRIMITGAHNHTGPNMQTMASAAIDTTQNQYYNYFVSQAVAAAEEAYQHRAAATMTKTTLDVSEVFEVQMNYIRHFALDAQIQYVVNGNIVDTNADPSLVSGANFGQFHGFSQWNEAFASWTDSNGKRHELRADVANQQHIATADDTMDLLKFEVASSDQPIVLINWQAHPDNVRTNVISADYIGSLRHRLEKNKSEFGGMRDYRVSFFQGATGNLVTRSVFSVNSWYTLPMEAKNDGSSTSKNNIPYIRYGYLLAKAALTALEGNSSSWSDPITGVIKTKQLSYSASRQTYSAGLIAAAAAYLTDKADGRLDNDADGVNNFPYSYDYNGKRYILSSHAHAEKIQSNPSAAALKLELNVILIGDGLAMVTAPAELSDRYNNETLDYLGDNIANDWDKLIGNTYGAPMILGYANNYVGYIANKASFHYNENATIRVNGVATPIFPTGSYEANTSYYAEGVGEELMNVFAELLQELATPEVVPDTPSTPNTPNTPDTPDLPDDYCQHCKSSATWQPLNLDTAAPTTHNVTTGHYILSGDLDLKADITVLPGNKVCLDLNGCALRINPTTTRAITVGQKESTTESSLSIQDSQDGGKIFSPDRVFFIDNYGKVYMYGGTIESDPSTQISSSNGGCIYITRDGAEFNLYGGTIRGGNAPEHGGTIYLWNESNNASKAQFNIYGGTVIGGKAMYGAAISCLQSTLGLYGGTILSGELHNEGFADCINLDANATVKLSGLSFVESIVCSNQTNKVSWYLQDNCDLRIPKGITYRTSLTTNAQLGTVSGGKLLSSIPVKDASGTTRYMAVSGTKLQANHSNPITYQATYNNMAYSLSGAISAYTMAQNPEEVTCIKLSKDITTTVNVSKTVFLDLNGYDISGVNVTSGATLYVMDSQTDDYYTPADFCFGSIGSVKGNVQAVSDDWGCVASKKENWRSAYVTINADDATSFHRVDFGITNTDLNPGKLGLRYGCAFFGDQIIADNFDGQYGIAVSIKADPAVSGTLDLTYSTSFSTFHVGGNTGSASYIVNILSTDNVYTANRRNGETKIYGRPYLSLNGQVIYGPLEKTSLKESLQTINADWDNITLQALKDQTYAMFNTFKSVMQKWNLDAIEAGARSYQ